ncbi:MAG: twin-arginine translocase TatA/TatE family subunit [Trueperaceae bacterium]|nr:twin-arginine translocase TatA/TatE family subunit [Trueperaceae bacterium]
MRIGPLGIWELLIILVVVLLIFGPRRLPEMAKGLGQSVREFRKGIRDIKNDFEEGEKGEPAATPSKASSEPKPASETRQPPVTASEPVTSSDPEAASEPRSDDPDKKVAPDA